MLLETAVMATWYSAAESYVLTVSESPVQLLIQSLHALPVPGFSSATQVFTSLETWVNWRLTQIDTPRCM